MRRFWWIQAGVFAVMFPVLTVGGVLLLFAAGMAGPGRPATQPLWFQVIGWMVMNPLRPGESFPTANGFANLFIAIGVNAGIWSIGVSCAVAGLVRGIASIRGRGRGN